MPFIEIDSARIFYQTFGADRPDRAPIILIHSATSTGHADWAEVAPRLARDTRVIVPDCRGHGQSSNPNLSYLFKEMAADTVELFGALGYDRVQGFLVPQS